MTKTFRCALGIAAAFAGLALDENFTNGPAISTAQAVIGRPLTPMSYAGVARRTTRRAAYAGAAYGGYGYAPPPVYAPPQTYARACTQTTDAYGQVYTTC
jgi:hypothetical protein